MAGIEVTLEDSLQLLAFLGVLLALFATLIGVLTIIRSTWRVTFGRGTLVLPFGDSENGPGISEILAEQLDEVEHEWRRLSLEVKKEEGLVRSRANLVDLGPQREHSATDRSTNARISTSLLSPSTARRSNRSRSPASYSRRKRSSTCSTGYEGASRGVACEGTCTIRRNSAAIRAVRLSRAPGGAPPTRSTQRQPSDGETQSSTIILVRDVQTEGSSTSSTTCVSDHQGPPRVHQ